MTPRSSSDTTISIPFSYADGIDPTLASRLTTFTESQLEHITTLKVYATTSHRNARGLPRKRQPPVSPIHAEDVLLRVFHRVNRFLRESLQTVDSIEIDLRDAEGDWSDIAVITTSYLKLSGSKLAAPCLRRIFRRILLAGSTNPATYSPLGLPDSQFMRISSIKAVVTDPSYVTRAFSDLLSKTRHSLRELNLVAVEDGVKKLFFPDLTIAQRPIPAEEHKGTPADIAIRTHRLLWKRVKTEPIRLLYDLKLSNLNESFGAGHRVPQFFNLHNLSKLELSECSDSFSLSKFLGGGFLNKLTSLKLSNCSLEHVETILPLLCSELRSLHLHYRIGTELERKATKKPANVRIYPEPGLFHLHRNSMESLSLEIDAPEAWDTDISSPTNINLNIASLRDLRRLISFKGHVNIKDLATIRLPKIKELVCITHPSTKWSFNNRGKGVMKSLSKGMGLRGLEVLGFGTPNGPVEHLFRAKSGYLHPTDAESISKRFPEFYFCLQ